MEKNFYCKLTPHLFKWENSLIEMTSALKRYVIENYYYHHYYYTVYWKHSTHKTRYLFI
jgi:hypothetical protein